MFNLETSINEWKAQLNKNNTLTNDDICELESHILDEIDSLLLKNLNEEEAFLIASHRLGSTETISSEFTKVNHRSIWLNKFKWFLSGFILISFMENLITGISTSITAILYSSNILSTNYVTPISLLTNVFFLVLLITIIFSNRFSSFVSKIYNGKKSTLYIILGILTFMNCIGFILIRPIYSRFISPQIFGEISIGSAYFMFVWVISLSCILFFIQRKNTLSPTTK